MILIIYRVNSEEKLLGVGASDNFSPTESVQISPSPLKDATTPPSTDKLYTSVNNEYYNNLLSPVEEIIIQDIQSGFPGAVLLISIDGETVFHKAYGYLQVYNGYDTVNPPVSMNLNTVFDVASLTKVYSTTLSIIKLIDSSLLSLDDYVYKYLPEFNKENYSKITIRQLLNHTSGFPADLNFFNPDVGQEFYSTNRDTTISLLSNVPLKNTPGEVSSYSDIGYMVLGAVIESINGINLEEFSAKYLYQPLSISDSVSFRPLDNGFDKSNIACTERIGNTRDGLVDFPNIRTYTLQGEVHDEKAFFSMDGISGHAGLFADARAINILNQMLLNDGVYEDIPIFSAENTKLFTSIENDSRYQLGFANAKSYTTLADTVPEGTLCHTGWTGAFSLIDKKNNLSIVLLTNKRHSPITDGKFEGTQFETGKYFGLIKTIYDSLGLS